MASTVNVERVDLFPNGTVVKAYKATNWHSGQGGVPSGLSQAEATMTSGKAELTGLSEGVEYIAYAEVGGKDVYLQITPAVAGPSAANPSVSTPAQQKLLGYSCEPASAAGTKILASGTLQLARVPVKSTVKVGHVYLQMTTKASSLTSGQSFVGLFDGSSGALLATSADQTAAFEGATGLLSIALTAEVSVPAGEVVVGVFSTGTTPPIFATGANIAAVNAGVSGTSSRFATADTGLTTALPSTRATPTAAAFALWTAVGT